MIFICRKNSRFWTTTCLVFWQCLHTCGKVSARCSSTSVSDNSLSAAAAAFYDFRLLMFLINTELVLFYIAISYWPSHLCGYILDVMWAYPSGRRILTELSLCYSSVYHDNGAQRYWQFLQVGWLDQALKLAWGYYTVVSSRSAHVR